MANPLRALASSPAVLQCGATLARSFFPRLTIGNTAVFSRWRDVQEILRRDLDFLIAPVNGERIERVNGPFILGMDRSARHLEERRALYAAFRRDDMPALEKRTADEASGLLGAVAAGGTIDAVNGYARPVAARNAAALIGIAGPSEQDRMRVIRTLFHECFLNLGNDEKVRARAVLAYGELKAWCDAEIARRKSAGATGDDMLGRMIADGALDDDGIRRTLSGVTVGAIDTTATCVAQIMSVILKRPSMHRAVMNDLNDGDRLRGWCWEALRFWPHNPILIRQAALDTDIGGKAVKKGMQIVCFTLAAMHDPGAFPFPGEADPARPEAHYLHFGGGLHPCAGRAVNGVQIPALVAKLLARDPVIQEKIKFEGPFPNSLILKLQK